MQVATLPPLTWVWFGTLWVVGGIGGMYFWYGSDAEDKRQLYPWFLTLTSCLMLGLIYFVVHPPVFFLLFFTAFAVVGGVIHVKFTAFCPRCARMINRGMFSYRVDFCPRCGLRLPQRASDDQSVV